MTLHGQQNMSATLALKGFNMTAIISHTNTITIDGNVKNYHRVIAYTYLPTHTTHRHVCTYTHSHITTADRNPFRLNTEL